MSNSAAQNVADKSVALAVAIARQKGQVRDSRVPTYSRELLGGNSPDDCAEDVASLVLGVKKVASGPEVCHLVLSALYVAFHTESLTKAHVKMSPGSAPGVPAVRAVSSAQRTAEVTVITSKIDLAGNVKAKDAIPKVTIEDASAILAMAVYAAGKAPSDTNKAGFLGEDGGIRGRAGTLRDAFGAHPEYVTGVRSLDLDDLKKISRAFSSNPGARHALFGPVALALVRPITVAEQIVSSQARLLRSEGMGSFERAITAVGTYGPALDVLSLFRADMEALARTMAAVASETYVMQTFGFILDRDAYDTVRVGNFVKLAQLGVLVAQKAGGSTTRIQPATPNLDIQAKVKAAFDLLEAA